MYLEDRTVRLQLWQAAAVEVIVLDDIACSAGTLPDRRDSGV